MKIHIEAAHRLRHHIKAGRDTGEGAGALFYCEDTGHFLILERSNEGDAAGTWAGLGGGRDNNEPLDMTVRREAFEEAGFPMDATCDLHYIDNITYDDGFTFHNYLCLLHDGEFEPQLNEEHKSFAWVTWDEFIKYDLHPGMKKVLFSPLGQKVLRKYTNAKF